jgi:hypothetical protein
MEAWTDTVSCAPAIPVQGAKLQVLGLAPLRERLGPRWERLSALVHSLIRKAIVRAQGPKDYFIRLDELSYAVTFCELSADETRLVCDAIAREVCELLFGNAVDEVMVRTVIASMALTPDASDGRQLEHEIERGGVEDIVSQDAARPMRFFSAGPLGEIERSWALLLDLKLKLAFLPLWDLRRRKSSALRAMPLDAEGRAVRHQALGVTTREIADIEIALLRAAIAYAARLNEAGSLCAVGADVGYETLCCYAARNRYIAALREIAPTPRNPLLLRIVEIPSGAPEGRLAELVAMLHRDHVRVATAFEQPAPHLETRLGADGIGGRLSQRHEQTSVPEMAERLMREAASQHAFALLEGLDQPADATIVRAAGVRFGEGACLGQFALDGRAPVPPLPLVASAEISSPG